MVAIPQDPRFLDLTGNRYGRLSVLGYAGKSSWNCQCACGKTKTVLGGNLRQGKSLSCGCLRDENIRAANSTHGLTGTPEYCIWAGIKRRCYNPNEDNYRRYGGAGITVCPQWLNSFETFLADMGPRPSEAHSIERKDGASNYTPENCKWATAEEQGSNKKINHRLTFAGSTLTVSQWARKIGLKEKTLFTRLARNWPLSRALKPNLERIHVSNNPP